MRAIAFAFVAALLASCSSVSTKSTESSVPAAQAPAEDPAAGLVISDKKIGTGPEAVAGKTVSVHYSGRLAASQKQFDSSFSRNKPFEFTLGAGQVIKGWDLGVAGMKVGGKRNLLIPAKLGYGSQNVGGGLIPPNSDLDFDVELLEVK